MAGAWLEEMKRRRVFRALIGYGIVAFAVLQVIEPVMHGLDLPDWVLKLTVVLLGLGFPFTLVLAWAFDINEGRIERAGAPRGRLLAGLLALGLLLAAPGVAWFFWRAHRAAGAGPQDASVAVLPFADLSPSRDQDWMCDGIAEEILDALCSVSGLRVAARSSSFAFKGKSADVKEMARVLGVSTLLEGSVRKVGERLRVSARLVSSDGYELWTDKFDRGVTDAFAIQDEIARAVAAALRLRVAASTARRGTQNAEAYELYLRGRQYQRGAGLTNTNLAQAMFRRAIALDAAFAQAHAGLADCDATLLQWLLVPKGNQGELRREALAESETALRLDPSLAEAHVARASVMSLLDRNDEADQSFRRAVALGPGSRDAWYWYARFLFATKHYPESAQAFEADARIDPDDYDALNLMAMPYARMGEQKKSLDAQRRSLEAAQRVLLLRPDDTRATYMSAGAFIQLGQPEKGLALLEELVARQPNDFSVLYNAACGFARAGKADRALDLLDRAVGTGQGFRPWLEQDPDLDSIRGVPRFQQILARLPQ
ncbi:MAG TPA: tetratricopeptide repeat protein [Myxococcales bacterium]|nr:tetratricopeptide repeat protein [Myxococcales bacterium]